MVHFLHFIGIIIAVLTVGASAFSTARPHLIASRTQQNRLKGSSFHLYSSVESESSSDSASDNSEIPETNALKCGPCVNAPKCSGSYREKGCDGNGKIQGGIATIPILSWWPIKVYRPCPAYLQAGYVYRREGQTLEQVLFSEPSNKTKALIEERLKREREEEKKAKQMMAQYKDKNSDSTNK